MPRLLVALMIAVVGGLLTAVAFPPAGVLRLFAVAGPLLLALSVRGLRARTAYFIAFAFGMAFFVPHIAWSGEFLGWLPWTALSIYQSVFVGLLGPALVMIYRLRAWSLWAACAWVAVEALRSRYFSAGFRGGDSGSARTRARSPHGSRTAACRCCLPSSHCAGSCSPRHGFVSELRQRNTAVSRSARSSSGRSWRWLAVRCCCRRSGFLAG